MAHYKLLAVGCLYFFICQCFAAIVDSGAHPHFSYNSFRRYGPINWFRIWSSCAGDRQSPINIDTASTSINETMHIHYDHLSRTIPGKLTNNGHVPVFSFADQQRPVLTGVPHHEHDRYLLEQIHLHFQKDSRTGSEHTVDKQFYSGEFHLVHYNSKYGNFSAAVKQPDGLAVIAVFLKDLGRPAPMHVEELLVETEETHSAHASLALTINPSEFLPERCEFYTYPGSLTTPGCEESVTWIVMATPMSIPDVDMNRLREMKDIHGNPIAQDGNCRPRQPHGTRIVEANFAAKTGRKKLAFTTTSLSGKNSNSLPEKEGH
ncbi:carbonic anhydrase 2-like [Haliotis cracherodii]|uniref:carbonic anhydrase 2-like n=1 Tax=Haliotis cracherodii TaxID=6455 RepID=UPI0039EB12CE